MIDIFDINENTPLYKVIENDKGELVYCDKDNKVIDTNISGWKNKLIKICKIGEMKWGKLKDIFLEKNKNKNHFESSNKLVIGRGEFIPKEEYVINGKYPLYTSSKEQAGFYDYYNFGIENKHSITFPTDNIPTFNINYGYAWAGNVCAYIENHTNFIDSKFLYYYLLCEKQFHSNDYMNKFSLDYLKNNYTIKLPQPHTNKETQEEFSSLEIQKSLSFLIEQSFNKIEEKKETLSSMKMLLKQKKESILENVFMNDIKQSELKDITLYKVVENSEGELEYELDNNGNKIELCPLCNVEFENKYIYTSKEWKKYFNKLLKEKKQIINSKDLINLLDIDKKYCCIQRMGETPSNENDKLIGVDENKIAWFNIANLQLYKKDFIDKTDRIENSISIESFENIKSIKNIPITKNDILVSFKLTVGVSKLYLSNEYSSCNEAIDILTPCKNIYSKYLNKIIGKVYIDNVGNNSLQGGTLNDDIKSKIKIPFPKETQEEISSLEIQKSISFYIEQEFKRIEEQLETIDSMILLLGAAKEEILNEVFKG